MSPRLRLLIVIALVVVLIGVGAAVILPTLGNTGGGGTATQAPVVSDNGTVATITPVPTALPTLEIIVAVQPINRGQTISPDLIDFRTWPESYAPLSAITNPDDVIGNIARVDIVREAPILFPAITESLSDLGAVGSDAAALLPIGTRMVSIPIDRITSVGYAIQPGDRVDLIVSLLFVDVNADFQTIEPNVYRVITADENGALAFSFGIDGEFDTVNLPLSQLGTSSLAVVKQPSEARRPRLTTAMTIQDALVVYQGDFPPDGRIFSLGATPVPIPDGEVVDDTATTTNQRAAGAEAAAPAIVRPDLVSLAVSPQEAIVLSYLIEAKVPITMALRPANQIGGEPVQPVDLEYIMNTYSITLPNKLIYSIEPAIRSIRQLISGDTISLRDPGSQTPTGEEEDAP